MRLAKQHLDVGLFTNNLEPMLEFWQQEVGLAFEEMLPTGGGGRQHRHSLAGGVLKINHTRELLPDVAPSGYRELRIPVAGIDTPKNLRDPDGNRVVLVPATVIGAGVGIVLAVRSLEAARNYYLGALGWAENSPGVITCGFSEVRLHEDASIEPQPEAMRAPGYRYLTVQVWDADEEYAAVTARGGTGAASPRTMGSVARFGFVRDPDGNWLELSQRASLTGPLPENS